MELSISLGAIYYDATGLQDVQMSKMHKPGSSVLLSSGMIKPCGMPGAIKLQLAELCPLGFLLLFRGFLGRFRPTESLRLTVGRNYRSWGTKKYLIPSGADSCIDAAVDSSSAIIEKY